MVSIDQAIWDRIQATIRQLCDMCPLREQATVRHFLQKWVLQQSKLSKQQLGSVFSADGLFGARRDVSSADRRALALINSNMIAATCPAHVDLGWIRSANAGAVAGKLELFPLRLFALQQQGKGSLLQSELLALLDKPETFLQTRTVDCRSFATVAAGLQDCLFYFDYENQAFTIVPTEARKPDWLDGQGMRVRVANVTSFHPDAFESRTSADFLVFSGTSYSQMTKVMGLEAPDCVVGVRINGAWELYAQQVRRSGWNEVTLLEWNNKAASFLPLERTAA